MVLQGSDGLQTEGYYQRFRGIWRLHIRFYPEDESDMFLWNVGEYLQECAVSHSKKTPIEIFTSAKKVAFQ